MAGLENVTQRIDSESIPTENKFVKIASAAALLTYQLTSLQQKVSIDTSGSASAFTLKLAPVAECKGKLVVLMCTGYSGSITVTAADSTNFSAPTISAANKGAIMYSDGEQWWTISAKT